MPAGPSMTIRIKRAYEKASAADGYRILVERLWPRGVSKDKAAIDHWAKGTAPSTELRQWYGHDATKWTEFRRRFFKELDAHPGEVSELVELVRDRGDVTFVFGSKEEEKNCAAALREYVEKRV